MGEFRAVLAAVAVLLAAPLAPPASAAPPDSIVISGIGTRSVDVRLEQPVTLNLAGWFTEHHPSSGVLATFSGAYVGLFVETTTGTRLGGAVMVRGWTRDGSSYPDTIILGPFFPALSRGTYRFVLVTDRSASLTLTPMGNRGTKTVKARATRPVRGIRGDFLRPVYDHMPAPQVTAGTARIPFTLAPRGTSVVAWYGRFGTGGVQFDSACVRPATAPKERCVNDDWYRLQVPRLDGSAVTKVRVDAATTSPGSYALDVTTVLAGPFATPPEVFRLTIAP